MRKTNLTNQPIPVAAFATTLAQVPTTDATGYTKNFAQSHHSDEFIEISFVDHKFPTARILEKRSRVRKWANG